jgi:DNA-binding response OmpR family regulator
MNRAKILIVDREPLWGELAHRALTDAGYVVEIQADSKFRYRQGVKFDLVLVDASQVTPDAFQDLETVVKLGSDGRPNIVILTPTPVSISQVSTLLKLMPREIINTPFSGRALVEQLGRILKVGRHNGAESQILSGGDTYEKAS